MAGTIAALVGGVAAWFAGLRQVRLPEVVDLNKNLAPYLSDDAAVWFANQEGFKIATTRWSPRTNPQFDIVVDVTTEEDVSHTIQYANARDMPFLALSGKHGYNDNLNRVQRGVGINLRKMNSVTSIRIEEDETIATIGGGIVTKDLIDQLWSIGKMTTAGTCECTGAVAPMLGGGHGWLQGRYGLMSDNLVSARLVLANGSAITVSDTEHKDLFWALKGAGHNFGIVTSFEYKVYDVTDDNENFALETMIFTGDKLEDIFAEANKMFKNRPIELTWFAMLFPMPDIDPEKPVIIFILLWQGTAVPKRYTNPFANLSPIVHTNATTNYIGLAAITGFSMDSPACQHGTTYIPYPVGTVDVPIAGIRKAYEIQASLPRSLNNSWTVIEGYSMAGVQAIDPGSTAFPERHNNLLISPFVMYTPAKDQENNDKVDAEAFKYSKMTRDAIAEAAGPRLYSYVNYNSGNVSMEAVYGHEEWRLEKLRKLKKMYDPHGRFNFYNPIS